MTPPKDPPKRAGSKPDLQGATVDTVVGVAREQAAIRRRQTNPGLPAPPAPGSAPPPPPRLPGELAPTAPAPRPFGATLRAPTPPQVRAQARRSDPPPSPAPPPLLPSARVPSPPAGTATTSLPPASQDPGTAAHLAQRREIERLEHAKAEERKRLELQVAVAEAETARALATRQPERFMGLSMQQALIGLVLGLTAAVGATTTYIGALATSAKDAAERKEKVDHEQTEKLASLATRLAAAETGVANGVTRDERRDRYWMAIFRKTGVQIRKPDGWPDLPELSTETPMHKPGRLGRGPVLIVNTPPANSQQ